MSLSSFIHKITEWDAKMAQQVKVFANMKAARNQSHKAWIHLSTVQTNKLLGGGASSKTGSKETEKSRLKKQKR